jgi:hypothetical protein
VAEPAAVQGGQTSCVKKWITFSAASRRIPTMFCTTIAAVSGDESTQKSRRAMASNPMILFTVLPHPSVPGAVPPTVARAD